MIPIPVDLFSIQLRSIGAVGLLSLITASCSFLDHGRPSLFFEGSETIQGSLEEGDQVNPSDQSFMDAYPVSLLAGQILMVGMQSADFDPYVEILDPRDEVIAADDDSGPDVNAYLAVRIPESAIYTIQATSFEGESTGEYSLSYGPTTIEWDVSTTGSLGFGDDQHPEDQTWMDVYSVEATVGQSLIVEMISIDFDAYIEVVDPAGEVIAQNDDQGGGFNALLVVLLEQSGTYQIRANAYSDPSEGRYELNYKLQF